MNRLQSFAKFIRRATQCSRDVHWRMKWDDDNVVISNFAGTCQDCGYRTEGIDWERSCPPVPKVKKPRVWTGPCCSGPPPPPPKPPAPPSVRVINEDIIKPMHNRTGRTKAEIKEFFGI